MSAPAALKKKALARFFSAQIETKGVEMARASLGTELHCAAKNETGLLGRIVTAMAQKNVFILHLCAYSVGEIGYLQLVVKTGENEKAREAISYFIPKIEARDVLIVEFENKVGTLAEVARILGTNGIGIKYVYGTSADGFKIVGVFATEHNQRAAELINEAAGRPEACRGNS